MTRLMTASLVAAFALSACASGQAERNATRIGSPDWRDLGTPPSAASGGSVPGPDAESPELDEGRF
jgi:hypothetical protein